MLSPILRLFRGWRAAVPLVVVALLSPGRAEARCGHPNALFKTNLITAEPSAKPEQSQPTEAPTVPAPPCHGPNCSGAPDRDVPPTSAPPTGPCAKEAARVLGALEPHDPAAPFTRDFRSPRPIRSAPSIFHPPRVG